LQQVMSEYGMASQSEAHRPTVSILIVEDDQAVAELLRTLFNDVPGWSATVTHDAATARDVSRQVRLSVLVVDVNLPGVSGLELLELLREDPNWHAPPVILVSAGAQRPEIWKSISQGHAIGFVPKPFDLDHLTAVVEAALASSIAGVEPS
jgi:DNA-binding response OmpR family regulator